MNPEERDRILEELSRLGATGPMQSMCERCNTGIQRHRCRDCFWGGALCATCLVEQHAEQPLHRIEVDHSLVLPSCFKLTRIRLGAEGIGIHDVAIDFCGCGGAAGSRANQLSQACLLATSHPNPGGAIAFDLGETTHNARAPQRRGSTSPAQEQRPNLWPTPFVPVVEQTWRPQRPRSQPIGVKSAQRLQAALYSLPAPAEEIWQNTMQDLEQEPANVERIERAWTAAATTHKMGPGFRQDLTDGRNYSVLRSVAGRTNGESIETGWVTASLAGGTDGEAVVSRWASDQWINVLGMATRAMQEPERREMLDEEYQREVWLQRHQEQRRRAWRTTQRAGDLGRARVSAQRDVDVEARRRAGWALNFHDLTGMEYIE
ncbi:hypothetical protein DFH09DRAFT_1090188 [Mycena vulgaris]|nr:hypothetical protein DFH09DRAFT_1090188 [Mycena vulgaris]